MTTNELTNSQTKSILMAEWVGVLARSAWRSLDRMDATLSRAEANVGRVRERINSRRPVLLVPGTTPLGVFAPGRFSQLLIRNVQRRESGWYADEFEWLLDDRSRPTVPEDEPWAGGW